MRLGIDLDDCVVNTFEVDLATCYLFNKENGLLKKTFYKPSSSHAPNTFNMNSKDDNDFFMKQRKEIIEKDILKPKFMAKDIINKLYEENYEIYFLTGRQDKYWGDACKESAKWLNKYGFKFHEVISNCYNKGQLCLINGIDVLIDDNINYISQANSFNIKTITFWSCFNKNYKDNLNSFASCWPEVYDKIKVLEKKI